MSAKHMGQVFDLALSQPQTLVLLALADHADHLGERIFPSMSRVAWKVGLSVRQAQRIVAQLVGLGLLELVQKATGRPGLSSLYRLRLDRGVQKPTFVSDADRETGDIAMSTVGGGGGGERGDISSERGDIRDQRGDIAMSPESPLRIIIENRTQNDAPESPLQGGDPIAETGGGGTTQAPRNAWTRLESLLGEVGLSPSSRSAQALLAWQDITRDRKVGEIREALRRAKARMPVTLGVCSPQDLEPVMAGAER